MGGILSSDALDVSTRVPSGHFLQVWKISQLKFKKKNEWKRKKQKQEQRGLSSSGFENQPLVGSQRPRVQGRERPEHRELSGEEKEPLLGELESQ